MIFRDFAPLYRNAGLQVMPLRENEKKPIVMGWSRFSKTPVTDGEFNEWLGHYQNSNIGIVTGEASGVAVVDIDTPDLVLAKLLEEALPRTPWRRVGQKGCALAFKIRKDQTKSFKIKNSSQEMIVEYMATGCQIVLPPSIHPITRLPYFATSNLWEVVDQLPELPDEIELVLRAVCQKHGVNLSNEGRLGFTDYIPSGARDVTLTQLAGYCSHAILIGQMKLGQAIGIINVKATELSEKVHGDTVDPEKHIRNFLKFLRADVKGKNKALPLGWYDDVSEADLHHYGLTDLTEHTDWAYADYIVEMDEKFRTVSIEDPRRMDIVEEILLRLSQSRLKQLDVERVLDYLALGNQIGLKIAALRKRLTQLKQGEIEGRDHSQIAEAMLKELSRLSEVGEMNGGIGRFNGSHWEEISSKEVKAQLSRDFGHLDGCRKTSDINGVYSLMAIRAETLPATQTLTGVNFVNGFLNDDLLLLEHSHRFATRYTLPFRYIEGCGIPPRFEQFLFDCWGHEADYEDRVKTLRQLLASMLFGLSTAYQRAILLFGAAGSGKSQLLKIFESLVPDDARCYVNPTKWGEDYSVAELSGKLLNVAGELSETAFIPGDAFKELVDGSEKTARRIYCAPFKFRPSATHLFASNHFPKTRDSTEGFLRRWIIFTFTRVVPEAQRTLDIGDIIAREERQEIASWAVGAFAGGRPNQIHIPPSSAAAIKQIGYTTNNIRGWVDTVVKFGPIDPAKALDERLVYMRYTTFCLTGNNHKPVSQATFRQRMIELSQVMPNKFVVTHEGTYLGLELGPLGT